LVQARSQLPQCCQSVFRSEQLVPHAVRGMAQLAAHCPLTQNWPSAHA
jgi:hypothetical protein